MCTGDNRDVRIADAKPNQVGKSVQYRSADFTVQHRIDERCFREPAKRGTELGVELCRQSLLLRLIPVLGLDDVPLCGAADINPVAQGNWRASRA